MLDAVYFWQISDLIMCVSSVAFNGIDCICLPTSSVVFTIVQIAVVDFDSDQDFVRVSNVRVLYRLGLPFSVNI